MRSSTAKREACIFVMHAHPFGNSMPARSAPGIPEARRWKIRLGGNWKVKGGELGGEVFEAEGPHPEASPRRHPS